MDIPTKEIYQDQSAIEEEIPVEVLKDKWHWGAFFWGPLWGAFNGVYWPILIAIALSITGRITNFLPITIAVSVFGLGIAIWFGLKGYRLAWENKDWYDAESFLSSQKKWRNWGIGLLCFALFILVLA